MSFERPMLRPPAERRAGAMGCSLLTDGNRERSRCVNDEVSDAIQAMEQMQQDCEDEHSQQQPRAANRGLRDEKQHGPKNFSHSQNHPDESRHVRARETVGCAREYKQNCLDQDHDSQRPSKRRKSALCIQKHMGYFSSRLRRDLLLISLS